MFCPKCGKELKGTPKFCTYCGAAIAEWSSGASTQAPPVQKQPAYQNQPMYQNQTQMNRQPLLSEKAEYEKRQESLDEPEIPYSGNSPRGNGPKKILLAVAGVAAAACVAGGSMAAGKWYASKKNASSESETSLASDETQISETSADGETVSAEEESAIETAALSDSDLAKKIAKYNTGSTAGQELMIDVFAENYTPGARDTNYAWDKTLFYTLEDVDPNSANDGRINGYSISKKMMKNAATGNKMEYEIYTNPENNKVNKIVSIEYFSDHLEITDYYYDDAGKVSFIFVRNDINYVPSYAVPTKDGQRYYFYNDCMTKWRVVSGGVQTNYVIGQKSAQQGTNPAGSVHLYSSLDAQQQANYDTMEKRMINAAYNTYNIVLAAEGLSEITGYVYNEDGTPLPDADVLLTDGNNQENLFKATDCTRSRFRPMNTVIRSAFPMTPAYRSIFSESLSAVRPCLIIRIRFTWLRAVRAPFPSICGCSMHSTMPPTDKAWNACAMRRFISGKVLTIKTEAPMHRERPMAKVSFRSIWIRVCTRQKWQNRGMTTRTITSRSVPA